MSECRPTCDDPFPTCFSPCEPGCTCPTGQVLHQAGETSRCLDKEECVFFELNGKKFLNGSDVSLGSIGEGDGALIFRTEFSACCRTQRLGECYAPDGEPVKIRNQSTRIYRNRGELFLRLNHRLVASDPHVALGLYCCEVPTAVGVTRRVCANILL